MEKKENPKPRDNLTMTFLVYRCRHVLVSQQINEDKMRKYGNDHETSSLHRYKSEMSKDQESKYYYSRRNQRMPDEGYQWSRAEYKRQRDLERRQRKETGVRNAPSMRETGVRIAPSISRETGVRNVPSTSTASEQNRKRKQGDSTGVTPQGKIPKNAGDTPEPSKEEEDGEKRTYKLTFSELAQCNRLIRVVYADNTKEAITEETVQAVRYMLAEEELATSKRLVQQRKENIDVTKEEERAELMEAASILYNGCRQLNIVMKHTEGVHLMREFIEKESTMLGEHRPLKAVPYAEIPKREKYLTNMAAHALIDSIDTWVENLKWKIRGKYDVAEEEFEILNVREDSNKDIYQIWFSIDEGAVKKIRTKEKLKSNVPLEIHHQGGRSIFYYKGNVLAPDWELIEDPRNDTTEEGDDSRNDTTEEEDDEEEDPTEMETEDKN